MPSIYNIYKKYFPVNNIKSLREEIFSGASESTLKKWRIFTSSLTRTPYMEELLRRRQKNICPICLKTIEMGKGVIHHMDYNHLCIYDKTTSKRFNFAQCENCPETQKCITKVVLLHIKCHTVLHIKEGRIVTKEGRIVREKKKRSYSREYWIGKTSKNSIDLIDKFMSLIDQRSNAKHSLFFNEFFIGLESGPFIYFIPRKDYVHICLDTNRREEWLNRLSSLEIPSKICGMRNLFGVDVNHSVLDEHRSILNELIIEAIKRYQESSTSKPQNHGKPWGHEEILKLQNSFISGADPDDLVSSHKRTRASILFQLIKLSKTNRNIYSRMADLNLLPSQEAYRQFPK